MLQTDRFIQVNILSCAACKQRITNIKKTWGKHFNNLVFYADFEEAPDIVKCTSNPHSTGNEEKTLNRLKQIKQNNIYDWYLFVDDDSFVNAKNLFDFISQADKTKVYGRIISGWGILYIQGGGGLLISKELIDFINPGTLYIRGSTFGDVFFGQVLQDNNLRGSSIEEFCDGSPEGYNLTDEEIKKMITMHRVMDLSLENLYKQVYNNMPDIKL